MALAHGQRRSDSAGTESGANERLARWNERYANHEETFAFVPAPLLVEAAASLPAGRALDLACGAGRHAVWLAERGWQVVAVDGAEEGLRLLRGQARERGVASRIDIRLADLEAQPLELTIESAAYDLVLDFFFLDRELLERASAGVRPGGVLVAAVHLSDPEDPSRNRDFRLAAGELAGFARRWGWQIVHEHEGESREAGHHLRTAELVARRPLTTSDVPAGTRPWKP